MNPLSAAVTWMAWSRKVRSAGVMASFQQDGGGFDHRSPSGQRLEDDARALGHGGRFGHDRNARATRHQLHCGGGGRGFVNNMRIEAT